MRSPNDIFVNGAFLHERYKTLPDATLVGVFQYASHAEALAKYLAGRESNDERQWIVTDLYKGEQFAWVKSRVDALTSPEDR